MTINRPPAAPVCQPPSLSPTPAPACSPPLKLRAGKHTHWEPLDGAALRQALVWNELPRQQLSLGGLLRTASGACFDFAGVVLKAGPCYQGGWPAGRGAELRGRGGAHLAGGGISEGLAVK